MRKKHKGRLILIGGGVELNKEGERAILAEISRHASEKNGLLVILTVATRFPKDVALDYVGAFDDLGVREVRISSLRTREDAHDKAIIEELSSADVVFFTGGDQLRITSQMGNTPALKCLRRLYEEGATIAGTSAGAAAMPETMLIGGSNDQTNAISAIGVAPGLGLVEGVVIDSHFAERGRFGRLLGAVVGNPTNVGLGIDEDTAIVTLGDGTFRVLGKGGVYVIDGSDISYSNLSERNAEGIVSIYDVRLHVLRENDRFDMNSKRPLAGYGKETEES